MINAIIKPYFNNKRSPLKLTGCCIILSSQTIIFSFYYAETNWTKKDIDEWMRGWMDEWMSGWIDGSLCQQQTFRNNDIINTLHNTS